MKKIEFFSTEKPYGIDYQGGSMYWATPELLNPPDGSYPHVEWDDLNFPEKSWVIGKRVAWAIEFHKTALEDEPLKSLVWRLDALSAMNPYASLDEVTALAASELNVAIEATKFVRTMKAQLPQPARSGHLMAEGHILERAKNALTGGGVYTRKVSFNEPVAAFTMLSGDRIAAGGDMLTSVTLTDTETISGKDGTIRYDSTAMTT